MQLVTDSLRDAVVNMVNSLPVDERREAVRDMMIRLAEEMQVMSARLRSLILLMGEWLPQPISDPSECSSKYGAELAECVMLALKGAYQCRAERVLGDAPFHVTELMQVWIAMGPLSMEIMAMFETGEYDFDDLNSTDDDVKMMEAQFPTPTGPTDRECTYSSRPEPKKTTTPTTKRASTQPEPPLLRSMVAGAAVPVGGTSRPTRDASEPMQVDAGAGRSRASSSRDGKDRIDSGVHVFLQKDAVL